MKTGTKAKVYLMLGLPGSGKTTFSKKLAARLQLPWFSLDGEYFQRVKNVQQEERDYAIEREVENSIRQRVTVLVQSGQSVILDFCPWPRGQRIELYEFVNSIGAEPYVYLLDVSHDELLRRLELRNAVKHSEDQFMTPQLLSDFSKRFEYPALDEPVQRISSSETGAD